MITKRAKKAGRGRGPELHRQAVSRRCRRSYATVPAATEAPIDGFQLDAAILRFLRRFPNETVDLTPLAEELGVDPYGIQLAVEALAKRRMVVAPFIEPGTAGGSDPDPGRIALAPSSARAASQRTSR